MADLDKHLGLVGVFCIASGAMISSGIFVLPGLAHAMAGPAVIFSYLLAGIMATPAMLSVAEIVSAMPRPGGDYFFITRTMGPAAGTVAGLLTWFSLSLKSGFALVGLAAFAGPALGIDHRPVAFAALAVFTALNLVGVKKTVILQNVLVLTLLAAMAGFAVLGAPEVDASLLTPFASKGWHAVLAVAGVVFVSYGGLLAVASVGGEVKRPGRNVPLGMGLALVVVTGFYTVCVLIASGTVPAAELDNSLAPLTLAAQRFAGPGGAWVMSLAAVLAFVSTANAGLLSASRYLLALAEDNAIPEIFGRVNARFRTPHAAVAATAVLVGAGLTLELDLLVKAASTVLILTSVTACLCVIVLRESRLLNYRPSFRIPLYPWLPAAGALGPLALLVEMGPGPLLAGAGLIAAGLFFYWFYGRVRAGREYALLHLVERLTDRPLAKGELEAELKALVFERDQTVRDRIDHLVERAHGLEIEGAPEVEALFARIDAEAARRYDTVPGEVAPILSGCCDAGIDVIMPGIAVAHVHLAHEGLFELLMVRCAEGAAFPAGTVRAFFVIFTGERQRREYVPTVAALAQALMDPEFMDKWLAARIPQGLRDLVLLGARRRLGPRPAKRL